jgi:hypothetical protein
VANDAVDDDDESDADVWKAVVDANEAVAAAEGGRMEAALVQRVDEFEVAPIGFKDELEPEMEGPRTGARGGKGGGESEKR